MSSHSRRKRGEHNAHSSASAPSRSTDRGRRASFPAQADGDDSDDHVSSLTTSMMHNAQISYTRTQQRKPHHTVRSQTSASVPQSKTPKLNLPAQALTVAQTRYVEVRNKYGEEYARRWIAQELAAAQARYVEMSNTHGEEYAQRVFAQAAAETHNGPTPKHSVAITSSRRGYDRLERHQFRLLDLLPGRSEEIYIELSQYDSFTQGQPYTALSWTWGSTKLDRSIHVKNWNSSIDVPRNCIDVLKQLRLSNHSRRLWVDVICINQRDPVEKAYQVAIMGHIYRSAETVVAYVGEEDDASRYVMRQDIKEPTKQHKTIVDRFLERRYFSRVWVIQEVALARRLVLRAGRTEIPWELFTSFCGLPDRVPEPPEVFGVRAYNLMEMRRWYQGEEQKAYSKGEAKVVVPAATMTEYIPSIGVLKDKQLTAVLYVTRMFNATLKRDKFFALLSLFDDTVRAEAQVDYTGTEKATLRRLRLAFERQGIHDNISAVISPQRQRQRRPSSEDESSEDEPSEDEPSEDEPSENDLSDNESA